jgi:hypothetical protein
MKTKFKIGDVVTYTDHATNSAYIAEIVAIRVNTFIQNEYIVSWKDEVLYENQLKRYYNEEGEEL